MRSSVLDNLTEDYVRTARAKGASERRVLIRHVLRNSLSPIATLLGLSLPGILAGALITEAVFNYPGMGYLFYQAAARPGLPGAARDLPWWWPWRPWSGRCWQTSPTPCSIRGCGT